MSHDELINIVKSVTLDDIEKKGLKNELIDKSYRLYFNIHDDDSKYCIGSKRAFNIYTLALVENKRMTVNEYKKMFLNDGTTINEILLKVNSYCFIKDT
jgi:putative heme iron utilization protein